MIFLKLLKTSLFTTALLAFFVISLQALPSVEKGEILENIYESLSEDLLGTENTTSQISTGLVEQNSSHAETSTTSSSTKKNLVPDSSRRNNQCMLTLEQFHTIASNYPNHRIVVQKGNSTQEGLHAISTTTSSSSSPGITDLTSEQAQANKKAIDALSALMKKKFGPLITQAVFIEATSDDVTCLSEAISDDATDLSKASNKKVTLLTGKKIQQIFKYANDAVESLNALCTAKNLATMKAAKNLMQDKDIILQVPLLSFGQTKEFIDKILAQKAWLKAAERIAAKDITIFSLWKQIAERIDKGIDLLQQTVELKRSSNQAKYTTITMTALHTLKAVPWIEEKIKILQKETILDPSSAETLSLRREMIKRLDIAIALTDKAVQLNEQGLSNQFGQDPSNLIMAGDDMAKSYALLNIKSFWLEKIATGKKTQEAMQVINEIDAAIIISDSVATLRKEGKTNELGQSASDLAELVELKLHKFIEQIKK